MSISVIVVTYNCRRYIAPCLESLLPQLGNDDELIVVDSGSTDCTPEVVEGYPRVRLIRSTNRGYAGGNNRGAAVAHGEYLVFINPDTVVRSGALLALVAPLQNDSDIGMTTARLVHMRQPELINTCGNTLHYTGLAYCRGAGKQAAAFRLSEEVDAVSGAAFAIRRSLFAELGGFDERMFMYVEDTDLSWRARLHGYRCWYAADALVEHDYHTSYTPQKAFYLERNRHVMLLKNLQRATYVRLLPALLAAEAVTWGFLLLNGPRFWLVKVDVYASLWHNRENIIARRRAAQALRKRSDPELLERLTHHLEFAQLANRLLAALAGAVFDPLFKAARWLAIGGRA